MTCEYQKKTCGCGKYICKATNPNKKIMDTSICEEPLNCGVYRRVNGVG